MDVSKSASIVDSDRAQSIVWIAILPLALLFILFATVIPVELRSPNLGFVSWSLKPADFILNILLFFPLGIALANRRGFALVAILIGLSLAIEVIQLGQAGRHACPWDLLANVLGGLLGARVLSLNGNRIRIESGAVGINRSLLITLLFIGGVAPLLALFVPGERHDFSNWDPSHRLAIGDEFTRDRAWSGTLAAWQVYDRALPRDSIRELTKRSATRAPAVGLSPASNGLVESWENVTPPVPIDFYEFSPQTSSQIYQRLIKSNQMSILAWIEPSGLDPVEDGRILTLSRDQYSRNFSLTQNARTLGFRLRTPASGSNGNAPNVVTEAILKPGQKYFVAATYDGWVSRVYVDGLLVGRKNLASAGSLSSIGDESTLALLLAFCGGCLSGLLIILASRPGQIFRLLLGFAGGAAVAALAWSARDWPVGSLLEPLRIVIPPLIGAGFVALSITHRPTWPTEPAQQRKKSKGSTTSAESIS